MKTLECGMATDLNFAVGDSEFSKQENFSPFETDADHKVARHILKDIMQFRRSPNSHSVCSFMCPSCHAPHLAKVVSAVKTGRPITFVLPAFPGKSPNLSKVLGPLPDMAEQRALQFLQHLCDRIRPIYSPGAQIIICSDGRVFSDIVGMRETDVTEYQRELDQMIEDLGLTSISTFNLDELIKIDEPNKRTDFIQMRRKLMEGFGRPLELLREKVLSGSKEFSSPDDVESHRMYCGITRFLVEDSTYPGQTKSRSAIQRDCKARAYEVIRRSNAWTNLIAERFPEAVRLSIHPQTCGSKKLGIRLIGTENWITPWHGVAVKINDNFILLKRTEAEALGAELVFSTNGRPSHFEIPKSYSSNLLNKKSEVQI